MSKAKRTAVERYHNRVARRYDSIYSDGYWHAHDTLTWEHLKAFLPRSMDQSVVDLGCGTGKWGVKLLTSGYRVTFLDVSGKMVEQARRKVEALGKAGAADFVQADLCEMEQLPARHFALAVCLGEALGSTDSPPRAVKQIRKCLQPGGVLVATFDNRLACLDHYVKRNDPKGLAEVIRTGKTQWLTRDRAERFDVHTYTPEQIRKLLDKCGFELLDMVGKTVLPLRSLRQVLNDPGERRRWLALERKLWRDRDATARASHLQFAARVV